MNDLVKWWKRCSLESSPYWHPEDKNNIQKKEMLITLFMIILKVKNFI
jgi:hypothetical protein